jgi:O-antigen/teichoic acid export membrane protein
MRDERRILFNTASLSVFEGLGQLANLVLIVSFARTYGANTMGSYSIGMAVGAVAAIFVSLGIPGLLIREISRDASCVRDRLGVLLPIQLILAPFAWLLASAVGIELVGNTAAVPVVVIACAYQVLVPVATLLLVPLQARELMFLAASCTLRHRLLILALGLVAIWVGASAEVVALTFIIGAFALMALAWRQTSARFGRPAWRFRPREAWQLYRLASPFFGLSALAILYARSATLMLSALTTTQAVGFYAVADRLIVAFGLGSTAFNAAVYPALARVAHASAANAQALLARCLRLLLVAAIPAAGVVAMYADEIVRLFYGTPYLDAVSALQVLAWTLPVRGAQALLGSQLASMNQQTAAARQRLAGLAVFLIASPLLIARLGFLGAAWAVLASDLVQLTLYWLRLRKAGAIAVQPMIVLAPIAAVAAAVMVGMLLADRSLVERLAGTIITLLVGMWGFGAVKPHDLRFLRTLLSGGVA